jgi:alpha-L-fucosidase
MLIRSLAEGSALASGTVRKVRLLGGQDRLPFSRDREGLHITLPLQKPCKYAFALKITGLAPRS